MTRMLRNAMTLKIRAWQCQGSDIFHSCTPSLLPLNADSHRNELISLYKIYFDTVFSTTGPVAFTLHEVGESYLGCL